MTPIEGRVEEVVGVLWNVSNMAGYAIEGRDGPVGPFHSFLFDDQDWTIRWAVVDASSWLSERKVLLPPAALGTPDAPRRVFPVDLTRQQIKDSPDIDVDAPVSRQHESDIYTYYGWQPYWAGAAYPPLAGVAATPVDPATVPPENRAGPDERTAGDPHLRSTQEVTGYYVHAIDDDIGHVEDFVIESDNWTVRYVVIDTKNWWPGKMVLVSPRRFTDVNWTDGTVRVDLTREQIKNGSEYDPNQTEDPAYDERARDYLWYGYV